jgi:hypothetical protein
MVSLISGAPNHTPKAGLDASQTGLINNLARTHEGSLQTLKNPTAL